MSDNALINDLRRILSENVTAALRTLLQEKHLYQNVRVDTSAIDSAIKSHKGLTEVRLCGVRSSLIEKLWQPTDASGHISETSVSFVVPYIKIYCSRCDRVEAFNLNTWSHYLVLSNNDTQVFLLSYVCQSCKLVPEVFLISRSGIKLVLCGRYPMETVEIPQVIPKPDRKFFSDAIVAFQSGQTLAANFLLRTFIEQFLRARSSSGVCTVDRLFEEYSEALPLDFKSRFPSLYDIYSLLSNDIHRAEGNQELFISSKEKVIKHFDARRLFELPDKTPATSE